MVVLTHGSISNEYIHYRSVSLRGIEVPSSKEDHYDKLCKDSTTHMDKTSKDVGKAADGDKTATSSLV